MRLRTILAGIVVLVLAFVGATILMWATGPASDGRRPALAKVPPLPPASRTSVIVAPVEIKLTAIRDALEANAPRNLTGKPSNPISKVLSNADIGFTVNRGPLAVHGKPDVMAIVTAFSGVLRVTGQIANQAAGGLGAIGGLLGKGVGKSVENLAGKALDQRADIKGQVLVLAEPKLTPAWRFQPNLKPAVGIADASLTIVGVKLSVANEVKPLVERQVAEQVARLQAQLRDDPFLEQAARREWAKLCRSVSIGAAGAAMPDLWLELRPRRAFAAQPRIDSEAVTLLLGVEAETRILPKESKPECPFPSKLEIVPGTEKGGVGIAVPIDIPFTEVNRLLEAQFVGKTFPEDKSGAMEVTVRRATVAASGDRLLISLRVNAVERTSWFGFGAEATVHVWGRPQLDSDAQVLRLVDVSLDLESEGLLGAAARAAAPYLEKSLAERTAIDLKPFAANARQSIEAAIAEFRGGGDGVRVEAVMAGLRIVDVAFDSTTLRIVAEADGAAKVVVTALPK